MLRFNILYRGPLSSCNYACDYCPFAKRTETREELARDRDALERFITWCGQQHHTRLGLLFTPWGEALIRFWYQRALIELTRMDHIDRAAIQTNLSCSLGWIGECRLDRLALWATFHPTEADRERFVEKIHFLYERGVRLSVGVVGIREHFAEIRKLRQAIPEEIYLWINAYKRVSNYYSEEERKELERLDSHFATNNQHHSSLNEPCLAGETSFTVDGDGEMRRCHFVRTPIGNIYTDDWQTCLKPRNCPNSTCSCHIGYVNLKRLGLDVVYGDGLLERIPLDRRI